MSLPTTFARKDWNLDFRSELYKHCFYATDAWAKRRDGLVSPWDGSTSAELQHLRRLKDAERPKHVGEIIREQDGAALVRCWNELLDINSITHPRTTELLYATMYLAGSVATYFKDRFHRVRPATLAPDLAPPIPTPRLPAYPGGHATQIYLMALTLVHLYPDSEHEIRQCADQVAHNREVAGVNYPSDTEAGRKLAQDMLNILTSECKLFKSTLSEARKHDASLKARIDSRIVREVDSLAKASESLATGRTS
jgi:hypothetical protein